LTKWQVKSQETKKKRQIKKSAEEYSKNLFGKKKRKREKVNRHKETTS